MHIWFGIQGDKQGDEAASALVQQWSWQICSEEIQVSSDES